MEGGSTARIPFGSGKSGELKKPGIGGEPVQG